MPGSRRILFPVDFSSRSRAVAPFVKSMAKRLDAKVTLLYAIQIPHNLYALEQVVPVSVDPARMEGNGRCELIRFYEPEEGAEVEAVADTGEPACVIASHATLLQPYMIMMGTHGYGRFRSLLVGSVAAKVLHDTPFPVWTAAHTEDPTLPSHACCRKILCAVALGQSSLSLLRRAVDFAALTGAKELRLVHGVADVAIDIDAAEGLAYQELLMKAASESMARLQQEAGTNLEVTVGPLPAAGMIHEAAVSYGADLVIVGRGEMHDTIGRWRSEAYNIVRHSPCPVLSF